MATRWSTTSDGADAVTIEAHDDGLCHRFTFRNDADGWRLIEVVTSCSDGVGAAEVRRVPIALAWDHLRDARGDSARAARSTEEVGMAAPAPSVREIDVLRGRDPVRRRTTWSDVELAQLAARYVELCADGLGKPTARLAEEAAAERGVESFSAARMRGLLAQARRSGLLTKTPGGTPGGRLTKRAERLLTVES